MNIIGKDGRNTVSLKKAYNGVEYFSFDVFEKYKNVVQGFSTRLGGVSTGKYAAMNLSFSREPENKAGVLENYRRISQALGVDIGSFVLSYQEHSTNVRAVTSKDKGKGVIRNRDYRNIDGLITNERGITLGAFFADCIPLYFYDKEKNVIGLAHSGWRGTCKKMGAVILNEMTRCFGAEVKNVTVCIGPGICQDCYQVGMDVYEGFDKSFSNEEMEIIFKKDGDRHFRLSLWKANEIVLKESGVLEKNIYISNICTACNPDLFYSHRVMGEKRGNMAAFIALK